MKQELNQPVMVKISSPCEYKEILVLFEGGTEFLTICGIDMESIMSSS